MAGVIKGITLEIDGNTTKLSDALKKPISQSQELQQSLKNVNTALKFDPKNVDLLNQKQQILTKTISSTEDELKLLKEAQTQYIASGKDLTGVEYTELQKKIALTERSLENLKKQQSNFSGEVQAMGIKLGEFSEKTGKVANAFKPVTFAVAGLGTGAVATAAEFESSMSQVQATMGITKDSMSTLNGETVNTMEALDNLAQKMGRETAFSAKEAADAINYLAMAGMDTDTIYNILPSTLSLAAAGGMGLADASNMVAGAMGALGLDTEQAKIMTDQLAKTASKTKTDVAQLGEGMLKIGGTAKSMSGGTAELTTALGILANADITAAEGGTHLRNIIMSLQNPTDSASETMKDLGIQVYDANGKMRPMNDILGDLNKAMDGLTDEQKQNLISKIFNKTDIAAANALLANTGETWDELQASITDSAGAAQEMADTQLDNLQGQLTLLKSALEGLAISMGNLIVPLVKKFVDIVQKAVDWLNGLSESQKKAIVIFAGLAASIFPVLSVVSKFTGLISGLIKYFGSVTTVGGKLIAFFKSGGTVAGLFGKALAAICSPIGLVVAAIGVLVGAFVTLWNTNEEFRNKIIEIWNKITSAFKDFFQGITNRLNALGFDFKDITEVIKAVWQGFCDFLAPVFEAVWSAIGIYIQGALDMITGILDVFIGLFTRDWDQFSKGIEEITRAWWNTVKGLFETAVNLIKSIIDKFIGPFKKTWESFWKSVSDTVNKKWNEIKSFISNTIESIKMTFSNAWNNITSTTSNAFNTVKNTISNIWNGIKTFFDNIINGIKNSVSNGWNFLASTTSNIFGRIKNTVSNIWDGIKNAITHPIDTAKNIIKNAIDTISRIVSGANIQLPHIKLPHFSISGGFSLNPLKVPSFGVSWYAKAMENGMILNSPTIFGALGNKLLGGGEAGDEAVVGVNSLRKMISTSIDQAVQKKFMALSLAGAGASSYQRMEIDYDRLAQAMKRGMEGIKTETVVNIDGRTAGKALTPYVNTELDKLANRR